VSVANLLAYWLIVRDGFNLSGVKCRLNIWCLALISGNYTSIYLSNLPGLTNAESNNSFLFVAANTITAFYVPNPSISTNN